MNEDRFAYVRSKRQRGKIWDIYEKDFWLLLNLDLKCMIQVLILKFELNQKYTYQMKSFVWLISSPVLKSSLLEFQKMQHFFVRHFAPPSIVRKGVLPKNRSLLWDWTPSRAQRIYKGQNSENPLRAITFNWSDLRTWFQRLWSTFLMLLSGIPHLPTLRDTWYVTYVILEV